MVVDLGTIKIFQIPTLNPDIYIYMDFNIENMEVGRLLMVVDLGTIKILQIPTLNPDIYMDFNIENMQVGR